MRFLVLQHEAASPPALFGDWCDARGHGYEVVDVSACASWLSAGEFDGVVSLGADTSVARGTDAWIAAELDFLRAAHERGIPVLGICFGGQALAAALGGTVRLADFVEVGWRPIAAPRGPLIGEGPWFRWHEDVFSVPPGAEELARSPAGPLAFTLGRSVGLQIHPETTEALIESWIGGAREQIEAIRLDESALRAEIAAAAPGARERAFALFDRLQRWWGAGELSAAGDAPTATGTMGRGDGNQ